jgi:hypothetical protein
LDLLVPRLLRRRQGKRQSLRARVRKPVSSRVKGLGSRDF